MPPKSPRIPMECERECIVCTRQANCRNYGVVSCDACKMFFRRTIVENLVYTCKKDNKCLDEVKSTKRMCRSCRLLKCLESGMEYVPKSMSILEVRNRKDEELEAFLKDLNAMDASWHMKLMYFYTEEDPSLEEVLAGEKVVVTKKRPGQLVSQQEWSFFSVYIYISSLMNFSFVQQLSTRDKLILFRYSTMKVGMLCTSMRTIRENKERVYTPDGQEVYPEALIRILNIDPLVIKRLCNLLMCRLRELGVSVEEFYLLRLIFFCNPAIPSLSRDARSILSTHQKMYTSALLQLCQMKFQHTAPSRLADLLSLTHLISKVYDDLQYIVMLFQCSMPGFKFHKLSIDTLHLSKNTDYRRRDE